MMLTLGSLFAGIGGFDLGFERVGFRTAWACEIDKAAQGVLRRRFPDAKLHSDVREVGNHNLEPVDVLTFGSPCQDLSVAGKRAGLAGERSGLFHEAARIIRELRAAYGKPDFAIWENVPGAFSSNEGKDFAAVVQTMVNLGARDVCWRVLDSRYFGVAQRRRRVFLIADFGGERAEQILFEPESLRGDIAPRRKTRKETTRGAGAGVASGSYWDGGQLADTLDSSMAAKRQTMPEKRRFAAVLEPVAFAQNTRDEVRLVNGDGQIVGALAAQPGMKQTTYVAQAVEPYTLAIRGRGDGRNLEYRNDGTANALLLPNGGRDGIGPGAVAQPVTFHPTQDPISSQEGVTQSIGFNWQNGGGYGAAKDGLGITHEGTGPLQRCQTPAVAVCATGNVTHALTRRADSSEDGCGRGTPITVQMLTACSEADTFGQGGSAYADAKETDAAEALQDLLDQVGAKDFAEWTVGIASSLQPTLVLQRDLHGSGLPNETSEKQEVEFNPCPRKAADAEGTVRGMREAGCARRSPSGWRPHEQRAQQLAAHLSLLSHPSAQGAAFLRDLRRTAQRAWVLRSSLPAVHQVGRSFDGEGQSVLPSTLGDGSQPDEVVRCFRVLEAVSREWVLRDARTESATRQVMACRRLMPIEAERLQGFPDGWTAEAALPDGTLKQQADGPRYKQLGNAVTVNVAEWIAKRISAAIKG